MKLSDENVIFMDEEELRHSVNRTNDTPMMWQMPLILILGGAEHMTDCVKLSTGGSQTRQPQIYSTASVEFVPWND